MNVLITSSTLLIKKTLTHLMILFLPLILFLSKNLVLDKLPRLMKRKLVMISTYSLFESIDNPSFETVQRVRKLFLLRNDPLIVMSLHLKWYTWRDIDKQGVLVGDKMISIRDLQNWAPVCTKEISAVASQVVRKTPRWLVYGSEALMVHDVVNVITRAIEENYSYPKLAV